MRRFATVLGACLGSALGTLWVAAPASAFAHERVHSPYLHAILDVLTLAVVTAPMWTAFSWGGTHRPLLLTLVGVVQVPVAIVSFVPALHPAIHAATLVLALLLTGASLYVVRRAAPSPVAAPTPATVADAA